MSVLVYNGVVLPYAMTTHFTQEGVGDDVSNTDLILTKFDIKVQCILNASYLTLLAPDLLSNGQPITQNAADIMNVVRNRLLTRRRRLSFKFNGTELIPQPIPGNQGVVDARNGPVPQSCTVTQLHDATFLMTYHVIAHYHECPDVNPGGSPLVEQLPGSDILFNRWSETIDIDNLQYTTRTREGKFGIRSDNPEGKRADEIRSQMAVVGVPPDFIRMSSSYTVSPDGLSIAYRITDREVFNLPPFPAFEAEGEQWETATKMGEQRQVHARIRLRAPKTANRINMMAAAVSAAMNRLRLNGRVYQIMESSMRLQLYDNAVEVSVWGWAKPPKDAPQGTKFGVWGFDYAKAAPLVPAGQIALPYKDRGSIPFLLQCANYYDPCVQTAQLDAGTGQMTVGLAVGLAGQQLETDQVSPGQLVTSNEDTEIQGVLPATITLGTIVYDGSPAYYTETSSNDTTIFIDYTIRSRYERDQHVYMMGVANPAGFSVSTGQPGQAAVFCQLASPTLLWVVDWTASRTKEVPLVPNPDLTISEGTPNPWVLMDVHFEPAEFDLLPDGQTPIYRLSGTYVYGKLNPAADAAMVTDLLFPKPPWIQPGIINRTVPISSLTQGIIS